MAWIGGGLAGSGLPGQLSVWSQQGSLKRGQAAPNPVWFSGIDCVLAALPDDRAFLATAFARASVPPRRDPELGKKIDVSPPRQGPWSCQSRAAVEGSGSIRTALVR